MIAAFLKDPKNAQYAPEGTDKIVEKAQKGGGLSLGDNIKLNGMLNAAFKTRGVIEQREAQAAQAEYHKAEAAKAQAEANQHAFLTMQAQQKAARQADMDAVNARMRMIDQGGGEGVLKPEVLDAQRARLNADPAVRDLARITGQTSDPTIIREALQNAAEARKPTLKNPPQIYQSGSHFVSPDGRYLGQSVFDQTTGEMGLRDPKTGKINPLPKGAEPITSTGIQKGTPNIKDFRQLRSNLTDAEISLRNMDRYIGSIGDASVGAQRLADRFSVGIKTLVGNKKLTEQELKTMAAKGQLQGLLGANRTNVVGGGVMTEQDALRIIERLGGDFDSLSNPEVVKYAISQVYADRYQQYNDDLEFYNEAVDSHYGTRGHQKAVRVPFRDYFAQPSPTTQPVTPAATAAPAMPAQLPSGWSVRP